jgi:hypothetical protein
VPGIGLSPGCSCCAPPCADATITVNVRTCTNTALSGITVNIKNGATLVATGTSNGSGVFTATLPAATGSCPSIGGILYTVEAVFSSETKTTSARACCGGTPSVTLAESDCSCLGLSGKTVRITTPRGTITLTSIGGGFWSGGESVPTTGVGYATSFTSFGVCFLDCVLQTGLDARIAYLFSCGTTAELTSRRGEANCGGGTPNWVPASLTCQGPTWVIDNVIRSVLNDTDTISDMCDECDVTSLTFSLDHSGVPGAGLGTETITVDWV